MSDTLLQYLKRPNPKVDSSWSLRDGPSATPSKSTNSYKSHDKYHLNDVMEWKSIGWKGDLEKVFGDILKLPVSSMPRFDDWLQYPPHLKEIHDENSLDTFLGRWNYPVVSTALSIAQKRTNTTNAIHLSSEVSIARGGQAWIPLGSRHGNLQKGQEEQNELQNTEQEMKRDGRQDKTVYPDWAGILLDDEENQMPGEGAQLNTRHYRNILPGDTKLSTKFKSEWDWDTRQFRGPIIQIFTYCRRANVPYGYIITQEELVMVHLFREGPETTKLNLEYKSIPWTNSGDDELTVNLVLWCLHMLAARKRPISGRQKIVSEYCQPSGSASQISGLESVVPSGMASDVTMPSGADVPYGSFKRDPLEELVPCRRSKRTKHLEKG